MSAIPVPAGGQAANSDIRVLVVDDSVVIRGLVSRWVGETPGLVVAGAARNGSKAVEMVETLRPDVVVLDIEMPEMDGLTALPLMLKKQPGLVVIMASTLTRRNAEVSLKALSLGAADYIPKPESNSGVTTSVDFRRELLEKIATLGRVRRARVPGTAPAAPVVLRSGPVHHPAPAAGGGISLRKPSRVAPRILAIGASTGGPPALVSILSQMGSILTRVPVVVTQHMPATFTAIFAQHLAKAAGLPAAEGVDGERLSPGRIYVAPGGRHMILAGSGAEVGVKLTDAPPVNFCRPAVDPLFDTVAAIYGPSALALVLTGMGSDGANGSVRVADGGGSVIAQDEATSAVWGMPAAVAHAGAACAVLPLPEIAGRLRQMIGGGA